MKIYGVGVETNGAIVGEWTRFTVDASLAGDALLEVRVVQVDEEGPKFVHAVVEHDVCDGVYACQYLPKKAARHAIYVSSGGVAVGRHPYVVRSRRVSRNFICKLVKFSKRARGGYVVLFTN